MSAPGARAPAAGVPKQRALPAGSRLFPGAFALAVLCTALPLPAAAQSDAALQLLRHTEAHAAVRPRPLLRAAPASVSGALVATEQAADGTTMVGVLVRVTGIAAIDELRAMGARIGGVAGDVVSIRIPVDALEALDGSSAIRSAQAARVLTLAPQTDTSMIAIHADALRSHGSEGWSGTTGTGTLIGIYDTGLDVRHGDFIDAAGNTRVVAVWDQTVDGNAPIGFDYGFLCDRARVQQRITGSAAACPMLDLAGHGTHVTGIAAGNGGSGRVDLGGVAPQAELVVVKGGNGVFSESMIIDGLVWLRDQAQALGRPMVVNLSLSGQAGPHDGSRLFERAVDNLSGPGFIIVTVSSNDGQNMNTVPALGTPQYFHARGMAGAGVTRFTVDVSPYSAFPQCDFNSLVMSLWYEVADSVEVTIVRPGGSRASARAGTTTTQNHADGRVLVFNAADGPDPENGDAEVGIVIDACDESGLPAAGTWAIELQPQTPTPSGEPIDLWLYTRFVGTGAVFGRDGFDNRVIVGSPGTAERAITVGAFVSRLCWVTVDALAVCYTQRESIGDLARFSAAGPTRDGRLKPEITAPGLAVAAASSRTASVPFLRVYEDGRHSVFEGTSMAAPHVAGTVALLLQLDPTLGPEEARALLATSASTDRFTDQRYGVSPEAAPSDWWGHGKLDACAAVLATAGDALSGRIWVSPASDTLPRGATLPLKVCAPGGAAGLTWHSTAAEILSVDAGGVVYALQEGTALIIGTSGTVADTTRLTVVAPATLAIGTVAASTTGVVRTERDARIPLLRVALTSDGIESTDLEQLGVAIDGTDASAWIVLTTADADGNIDLSPPFPAATQLPLNGAHIVALRPDIPITIPQRDTVHLAVLLQTSGAVPNGTQFRVGIDTAATETRGTRSGARDRLAIQATATVVIESTLLDDERVLAFSENPVRRSVVHFNFRGCPERASIHTLTGSQVRDLRPLLLCGVEGGSAEWDLTNGDGAAVAPGVYLVLFDVDGRIFREKLMVLRPSSPGLEDR